MGKRFPSEQIDEKTTLQPYTFMEDWPFQMDLLYSSSNKYIIDVGYPQDYL
jgi:hypothetical protein